MQVDRERLPDGTELVLRPIRPEDAEALVALHARLSADTVYRRYFGARPHLSPRDVARFTRVVEPYRFALVALDSAGDLVAVARYEGGPDRSDAEIAVVVNDALQHRGVGRILLGRLVDVACERGLDALLAEVLAGNTPMLRMLAGLGLATRSRQEAEVVTVVLDLAGLRLPAHRRERAQAHIAHAAGGTRGRA